ncbi:unnamed protein product [Prorocentrum cordatum]|uniref:Secreted protein n=1 Tax=Prorocentrum cordatum TaxID=2364126 RepID=A0ABN9RXG3_9DINO|nr:unnamed protein product [Polarella glacialis]
MAMRSRISIKSASMLALALTTLAAPRGLLLRWLDRAALEDVSCVLACAVGAAMCAAFSQKPAAWSQRGSSGETGKMRMSMFAF